MMNKITAPRNKALYKSNTELHYAQTALICLH